MEFAANSSMLKLMTPALKLRVGVFNVRVYSMINYLMVFTGGGIGAAARFAIATWIGQHWGRSFPLGTFIINITGSFLIGLLMTLITARAITNPQWRLFLVVGGLGGYTTFSTFEYDRQTGYGR